MPKWTTEPPSGPGSYWARLAAARPWEPACCVVTIRFVAPEWVAFAARARGAIYKQEIAEWWPEPIQPPPTEEE